jgi:hypothetical protein
MKQIDYDAIDRMVFEEFERARLLEDLKGMNLVAAYRLGMITAFEFFELWRTK